MSRSKSDAPRFDSDAQPDPASGAPPTAAARISISRSA